MQPKGKRFFQVFVPLIILFCMSFSPTLIPPGAAWQSVQPEAAQAGPIVVGINGDPLVLDPALATGGNELLVATQVFDTLVAYQPGGSTPKPSLAESWEISPDGLTWTFNLRPGVVFQDGTPLDADAVLFNLLRWWDPDNPYHEDDFQYFAALFGGFKGDAACRIADISAVGSSQVIVEMNAPYMQVPSMLAIPAFGIASPDNIKAGQVATQPVGSGPYRFVNWTAGDAITLQANLDYWGQAPFIDNLTFKIIPDDTTRYNALSGGTIQVAYDLPESLVPPAAANPLLRIGYRGVNVGYLGMNRAHGNLDDPLVRQAIAHAIDQQALIESLYTPGDLLANQLLPPVIWGYNPGLQGYTYDPQLSQDLLAQAGYPLPINTTLAYRDVIRAYLPNSAETANQIAAYLQAVGIHADVIEYDSSTFITKYYNGELDLFLLGWVADYLHPDNFFSPLLCDPTNFGLGPLDPVLCDNVQAALEEPDLGQQELQYQAISQEVHNKLPLLPLAHTRTPLFYRYDVVGLVISPLGVESFKDVDFAQKVFLPLVAR